MSERPRMSRPARLYSAMASVGSCLFTAGIAVFALANPAVAQNPSLLKDINVLGRSSRPTLITRFGSSVVFEGVDWSSSGREPWISDGTALGTQLLKDINPGSFSSFPQSMFEHNGEVFFSAALGATGRELWKTDGTSAGTVLVKDINPGSFDGMSQTTPAGFTSLGTELLFVGISFSPSIGGELWKTDGTEAGTVLVEDLLPGIGSFFDNNVNKNRDFAQLGGMLYFSGCDGTSYQLFTSDGTAAGTGPVTVLAASCNGAGGEFEESGGVVFFVGPQNNPGLWVTDGTALGTVQLNATVAPDKLVDVNGTLAFSGTDANGRELWKSDGTVAGTVMVKDIAGGGASSDPADLVANGSTLFFTADDGTEGKELWASDLSTGGTALVTTIQSGPVSSEPQSLIRHSTGVAFVADDGSAGLELWRSDGTAPGTMMIDDLETGADASAPQWLEPVGANFFFSADVGQGGVELWMSDGTAGGTGLVADPNPETQSSIPTAFTELGGTVIFGALPENGGGSNFGALWETDGTVGGTSQIVAFPNTIGSELTILGSSLIFQANDPGVTGTELWTSDGTAAGTALLKDINTGPPSSSPFNFVSITTKLVFSADDGTNGKEPWVTDGTLAGTSMLANINPGGSSNPFIVGTVNGKAIFWATDDGTAGRELWASDGTPGGTTLLQDIVAGSGSPIFNGSGYFESNGELFFRLNDLSVGGELWKTDGTTAGTTLVIDLIPGPDSGLGTGALRMAEVGSKLIFIGASSAFDTALWETDGTAGGTSILFDPCAGTDDTSRLISAGPIAFFKGGSSLCSNRGLWKTDGTVPGTELVMPGFEPDLNATNMLASDGEIFFPHNDGANGIELWTSDGTPAGTVLVADINPGSDSSSPQQFAQFGNIVYFSADDGLHGLEPWTLVRSSTPTDFGDAPDPTYPTLLASDGARHALSGLFLGAGVDAELDGQPDPAAVGDDMDPEGDDEDGVDFPSGFSQGQPTTIDITASAAGLLNAWFDYDQDGAWSPAERVFTDEPLVAGVNNLIVAVPASAVVGTTFARFRLDSTGGLGVTGAAIDGEVEDYQVEVGPAADLAVVKMAPGSAIPGNSITFTLIATNATGPSPTVGALVTDTFEAGLSACTWTCVGAGGGSCAPSGSSDIAEPVDLPLAASVTFTATCDIDSDSTADVMNTASIDVPLGTVDPVAANDTSGTTTTLLPSGDLSITKTDGVPWVIPPATLTYTILADNPGPSDALGVAVDDQFPVEVTNVNWTCVGSTGGLCAASGAGDISELVDLPAGAAVTFTATADTNGVPGDIVLNTATVTEPGEFTDPNSSNNSATDQTNYVLGSEIFMDGFESGDTSAWSATTGGAAGVLVLDQPADSFETEIHLAPKVLERSGRRSTRVLSGQGAGLRTLFELRLETYDGRYRLAPSLLGGSGEMVRGETLELGAVPSRLTLTWRRALSAGVTDGRLLLTADGAIIGWIEGIDNSASALHRIQAHSIRANPAVTLISAPGWLSSGGAAVGD